MRFNKLWSALLRPSVVLDTIGKNATSHAQISSATGIDLTQMMMSGAIATIGVTWRITAYGNRLSSTSLDWVNTIEMSTPATVATSSAAPVIASVTSNDG